MTRQTNVFILLACLLNLLAAVSSMADEVRDESARKCISARNLTSTVVVDDRNVLFFMIGKTIYHNILPKRCAGLARSGSFHYSRFAGRLCSFDPIRKYNIDGSLSARSCLLGDFHPVTKEDLPAIIEGPHKPPRSRPLPSSEVEEVTVESDVE